METQENNLETNKGITFNGFCNRIRCLLPVAFLLAAVSMGGIACFKTELWEIEGFKEFTGACLTAGIALSNATIGNDG